MKVWIKVETVISTMQEVDIPEDFNVNDEKAMNELAHNDFIQSCLQDNISDCLYDNSEVVLIETDDKTLYEKSA